MGKKMSIKSIIIKNTIEIKIIKSIKTKIENIINRIHRMIKINSTEMIKTIKYLEKMRKAKNLEKLVIKYNQKILYKKMRIKTMTLKFFKNRGAIEIRN
jgi:hypothetical protein